MSWLVSELLLTGSKSGLILSETEKYSQKLHVIADHIDFFGFKGTAKPEPTLAGIERLESQESIDALAETDRELVENSWKERDNAEAKKAERQAAKKDE